MEHDCRYTPTIMSGPVVRFGLGVCRGRVKPIIGEERDDWSAEISASADGVVVSGYWPACSLRSDIDALIEVLNWAWAAHVSIHDAARVGQEHEAAKSFVDRHNARIQDLRAEAAKIPSPF